MYGLCSSASRHSLLSLLVIFTSPIPALPVSSRDVLLYFVQPAISGGGGVILHVL